MIKILHSADWHLDAPLNLRDLSQREFLLEHMMRLPGKIASLCREYNCDLMLLSGDLFDGPYAADTLRCVQAALEEAAIPVFISPGNHDFIGPESPWLTEYWPENVHIFKHPVIESVTVGALDCCVYGAGYTGMDCNALLEDFSPKHNTTYSVAVLHGDPTLARSPYCPVTARQAELSGLDYLALGHIHQGDQFRAGKTLCAWPGCPMGHGFDEPGDKGVLLTTLDAQATTRFLPLGMPRFHNLEISGTTPLSTVLPPVGNRDFYRITFTGPSAPLDLAQISRSYAHFPHLTLRDKTTPPVDIWSAASENTLEGRYFKRLLEATESDDSQQRKLAHLAAEISRKLLDGQEVVLP